MSRGKRYDGDGELNKKKVAATIIAIVVIIMVIISIKNWFSGNATASEMTVQTSYFTVYDNDKYGVIDNEGNYIIDLEYDEIIIIPDETQDVFICTYNVDYDNETYETKVLDSNGNEILTNYSNVQAIEKTNVNEVWYDTYLLIYEENGLYGLIDFSGKKITDAEYTTIYALDSTDKSIVVEKDGKKGIVNSNLGSVVIDCNYDNIITLNEDSEDDGYIVLLDGLYGVVSASGKEILDLNYTQIKQVTGNSMYVVEENENLKIIDSSLNVILSDGFDSVKSIDGENIIIEKDGLYGVINKSGEELILPEYEDLTYATDNYYVAKKDSLYGIISSDNIVCVDFKYTYLEYINSADFYQGENSDYTTDILNRNFETKLSSVIISDLNIDSGYIKVRENGEYKYYNLNFEEKTNIDLLKSNTLFLSNNGDKYGYVNKNGDLIVDYIYDDATEQNSYGYCAVKQDGLWGVLASDGTVILTPSVDLDDNLYISFIDEWHLFEDASLNIYVK